MSLSSQSLEVGEVSSSPLEPPRPPTRKSELIPERAASAAGVMQPPAPPARVTLRRPSRREQPPSPLVGLLAPSPSAAPRPAVPAPPAPGPWRDATESHASWSALLSELCAPDAALVLVAELEDGTTTLWPRPVEAARPRARAAQLSVRNGSRWRVRLEEKRGGGGGEEGAVAVASLEERRALLRSALSEVRRAVCWRAKDALVALRLGPAPGEGCRGLCDPQVGLWMLDSADEHLPLDEALRRCAIPRLLDAHEQQERLASEVLRRLEEAGLAGAFASQEMPLVPVLAQLETAGMLFDVAAAQRHRAEIAHAMDLLQREATAAVGGREINLGSAQQVARLLFDELGLCPAARKRTGTGARLSASKEVLQELKDEHPVPGLVLRFRKLQKLSSTWLDGLAAQVRTEPDAVRRSAAPAPRLCSEWLQTSTRTGRLSSANPNFQNLPVRPFVLSLPDHARGGELREVRIAPRDLFVARPGFVLLSCDYAQMEMRLLASLSGDAKLREFFRGGRDIHREVYAHWKRKAVEAVTDEERETAKRVVYALMYGMGPAALTGVLRCSPAEARHFLSSFLSSFPAVRAWMERVAAAAERDGFCLTIAGRRRLLPRDQARHLAVNSVVQGSAADIMKQALIELHRRLAAAPEEALLVSTVHDEVVLEVRSDALERVRRTVLAVLETCGPGPGVLAVPLVATSCVGPSLGQLK